MGCALLGPMKALVLTALCACTNEYNQSPDANTNPCVRIEGEEIGQRVTLKVNENITFVSWKPKLDAEGKYVGFALDAAANFIVKADFNVFYELGSQWENPFGDSGSLAKAIDYVDVCEVWREDRPVNNE